MANPLMDALEFGGYALDTPGAYLRGLLAGQPGQRVSGEDLLGSYGVHAGPMGGFAAEAVLDPLSLAAPLAGAYRGIRGLTRAGTALSHADVNPLLRGIGHMIGDESGALGPGATRLAEEVAGQPWHYRSYDPTFHPDQVDPLQFPITGPQGGEVGNVRGVVGLSAGDTVPRPDTGYATRSEIMRDMVFGEDPATGKAIAFNPDSSARWTEQRWRETFPDAGLAPARFEATVAPRGVLDLRPGEYGGYPIPGDLKSLIDVFADRSHEASARLASVSPGQWPGFLGRDVVSEQSVPHQMHYLSHINAGLIDAMHSRGLSPSFWGQPNADIEALMRMGFHKDPLRQLLADEGYDAILGHQRIPWTMPTKLGGPLSPPAPFPIETMLNILDPRAIKTWQPAARAPTVDWRPDQMLPEDFFS